MGGRRSLRVLASLRGRAVLTTCLGLAVLAGLVVFDSYDEARLLAAHTHLEAVRQLDADNRALSRAVTDADASLATYAGNSAAASIPGAREELLAEYLQQRGAVSLGAAKLQADAAAAGLAAQERAVADSVSAWQAWAQDARLAADARDPAARSSAPAAEGQRLLIAFRSADSTFSRQIQQAEDTGEQLLQQRNADHVRVFYGGLLVDALVIVLLALAVVSRLLNPIARLTASAAALAEGAPTSIPYIERTDEVGSLARALSAWQQAAADVARVFERSPLGMARVAVGGEIVEVNPSLRRMLPGARLIGRRYDSALQGEERVEFGRLLAALERGERGTFVLEARHTAPHRASFWGNITVAAVPATDGAGTAYALLMLEDVDLRKQHELALAHRAAHDPLTGLPNRILFGDRLEQALRAARRRQAELSVLLLDLDRFKPINDELGHTAGDAVLQQLAERMRGCFRESDTMARIGGDEFAVVLAEDGAEGAKVAARKLLAAVAPGFSVDGVSRSVGLSIGIATYPRDASSGEGLIRAADAAMYEAKRRGSGVQAATGPVARTPRGGPLGPAAAPRAGSR